MPKTSISLATCTWIFSLETPNVSLLLAWVEYVLAPSNVFCLYECQDPHAACFPLHPSYLDTNGERVPPIAAMVANFTKP